MDECIIITTSLINDNVLSSLYWIIAFLKEINTITILPSQFPFQGMSTKNCTLAAPNINNFYIVVRVIPCMCSWKTCQSFEDSDNPRSGGFEYLVWHPRSSAPDHLSLHTGTALAQWLLCRIWRCSRSTVWFRVCSTAPSSCTTALQHRNGKLQSWWWTCSEYKDRNMRF